MSEHAELRTLLALSVLLLGLLSASVLSFKGTPIKEIDLIIETTRYIETHRVMHISYYTSKRVSFEGEWVHMPQGNLRTNVLLFDRTEPPDPQLTSGEPYTIRFFDTHIWRVISIKEMT